MVIFVYVFLYSVSNLFITCFNLIEPENNFESLREQNTELNDSKFCSAKNDTRASSDSPDSVNNNDSNLIKTQQNRITSPPNCTSSPTAAILPRPLSPIRVQDSINNNDQIEKQKIAQRREEIKQEHQRQIREQQLREQQIHAQQARVRQEQLEAEQNRRQDIIKQQSEQQKRNEELYQQQQQQQNQKLWLQQQQQQLYQQQMQQQNQFDNNNNMHQGRQQQHQQRWGVPVKSPTPDKDVKQSNPVPSNVR